MHSRYDRSFDYFITRLDVPHTYNCWSLFTLKNIRRMQMEDVMVNATISSIVTFQDIRQLLNNNVLPGNFCWAGVFCFDFLSPIFPMSSCQCIGQQYRCLWTVSMNILDLITGHRFISTQALICYQSKDLTRVSWWPKIFKSSYRCIQRTQLIQFEWVLTSAYWSKPTSV